MSFDDLHKATAKVLTQKVDDICKEFAIDADKLSELTAYFVESMEKGLQPLDAGESEETAKGLPMIPSFVTGKPNGTEKGVLLAADLGGTNFRVCSVDLSGDHTFSLQQMKSKIPEELLEDDSVTSQELFGYLARRTVAFMKKYHPELLEEHAKDTAKPLKMGFTFSYPIDQKSLGSGTLIRWTKGFKIKDTIGKDVVQLYQEQLNASNLGMITSWH